MKCVCDSFFVTFVVIVRQLQTKNCRKSYQLTDGFAIYGQHRWLIFRRRLLRLHFPTSDELTSLISAVVDLHASVRVRRTSAAF